MTSPDRPRPARRGGRVARRIGGAALVVATVAGLAGCGLGQPRSFTGRSEKVCASATRTLAKETPVISPVAYTIDRFNELDRVLVTVSTDTGFPNGAVGQALRVGWIIPARTALRVGRPRLEILRLAVVAKSPRRVTAFAAAARIGEAGVNTAALRQAGMPVCAALFTAPAPEFHG